MSRDYPTIRESLLYETLSKGKVKCGLCERGCTVSPDRRGYCKTRKNIDGKLYTLTYGDISAFESRPIEIKPFFHFYPGSRALTFSTWSCNFSCPWCQNHHLSKIEPDPTSPNYISPEFMVKEAIRQGDNGLCVSFTEPTMLFEYSLDAFRIAKENGLYTCYVSNGYLTLKALHVLKESGMDAIKIDMKGDSEVYKRYCGGVKVEKVWRNARRAKEAGMHVEIVNLVITGVNDDEDCLMGIIERHLNELGPETPLHFTRYYPAFKFTEPQTKVETLENAYNLAKGAGVLFPYLGNVPGHRYENTYCPNCGELLINRFSYGVLRYNITKDKRCPKCGNTIPITGGYIKK
ncbi:MAG: AmmeMemoRadiSam system radical SAM enzyme [Candidatus Hydrothermarchaeales archaeon]